jgi:Coenzyme PQQ synthesis protein D (PqqD)
LVDLSQSFVRADILETDVDGELVMMSIERGNCYSLEGSGAAIWKLLSNPISGNDICTKLADVYDVAPSTCHADVQRFLQGLLQEGLIKTVE